MAETDNLKLQLSPRLSKIAELLPPCKGLADIGTDHGYIPIYSLVNKISDFAIASDINPGPVERARANAQRFGLLDKISLRVGPGIETVQPNEAEVFVVAGMGGILISEILDKSKETLAHAKTLILQPMTAARELREYLCQSSFSIDSEVLVAEDDKLYNIITASLGEPSRYTEKELILGRYDSLTDPQLVLRNKKQIIKKLETRLQGLEKSHLEGTRLQIAEIKRLVALLEE